MNAMSWALFAVLMICALLLWVEMKLRERSERISTAYAGNIIACYRAISEMHDFIVNELDPEPHPVEAYITDPAAQRQARVAVLAATEGDRLRKAREAERGDVHREERT